MKKSAIVLFSGGLDSTTCVGIALDQGFEVIPVSFAYGQRHEVELAAASKVVQHYGLGSHHVVNLGIFRDIGGSALTEDIEVPTHASVDDLGDDIPVTYVPARNLVFLSHAVALAEVSGAHDIFIGVNALDYSGYPDCRPEFIRQFEATANLGTKTGAQGESPFQVHAPLVDLTKAEIVTLGTRLGVPYELTHSCYSPDGDLACGHCDSCLLRLKGFEDAGLEDPVSYATTVA